MASSPTEVDATHGAGYRIGVRIEAFQRGDMDALGEVVDDSIEPMWRLARRGFLTEIDGIRCYVPGIEDLDAAEDAVEHAIADALEPAARTTMDGRGAFDRALLLAAQRRWIERAKRAGTLVDVMHAEALAEVPDGVEDLDRLVAEGAPIGTAVVPPDAGAAEEAAALTTVRDEYVAHLDERSQDLVKRRFVVGESRETIAAAWTCGIAAVTERENRTRRKLAHTVRRVFSGRSIDRTTTDALLAGTLLAPIPAAVTRERIRTNVLRRIHIDEPRSFGARAVWAVGAAAVAFVAWLLMFLGVLPYYDDDTHPTPAVSVVCDGACAPGKSARVHVLAPRDASNVAILAVNAAGEAAPLLVSPTQTTLRLPFGARSASTPIAYPTTIPDDATAVLAVFADDRMVKDQIAEAARTGGVNGTHVVTASTAVR